MLFLETIDHNFMDAEDIAKNFFTMNRNEAIEIVKKNWPNNDFTQLRDALETLIPELRVNEDERIKMDILEALRYGLACEESVLMPGATTTLKEAIAYLERQKEQKAEIKYIYPIFKVGDTIKPKAYNETHRIDKIKDDNYVLDNGFTFPIVGQDVWEIVQQKPAELPKSEDYGVDGLYAAVDILQKTLGEVDGYQTDDGILEHKCAISAVKELYEQKPAEWSEEDEEIREEVIGNLCALKDWIIKYDANWLANPVLKNIDKRISWLKFLRPQPMQEWSEEDKKCIQSIISCLKYLETQDTERRWNGDHNAHPEQYAELITKLQSIFSRSNWKPSEEQMEALDNARFCKSYDRSELDSLYTELKKQYDRH